MVEGSVRVYNVRGRAGKGIKLPEVFKTPLRPDVIKRAVIALQSHRFQPQGRDVMAGKRTSAESLGTGLGLARIPRVKGSRFARSGQGALAPGTVGGRQAHPPKVEKDIFKKINKKERRLAIRSAIAATSDKRLVASRGHVVEDFPSLPLVVTDKIQDFKTTEDVQRFLTRVGVWPDVERVKGSRKVRAGKGTMRGRRTKQAVGPLIVVSDDGGIGKAARNLPGVDVVRVEKLNAELLAPGAHPGRLTVWSASAVKKLDELFV